MIDHLRDCCCDGQGFASPGLMGTGRCSLAPSSVACIPGKHPCTTRAAVDSKRASRRCLYPFSVTLQCCILLQAPWERAPWEHLAECPTCAQGWEWKNEGKRGFKKVGWISSTPGSKLLLKVRTAHDAAIMPALTIIACTQAGGLCGNSIVAAHADAICKGMQRATSDELRDRRVFLIL